MYYLQGNFSRFPKKWKFKRFLRKVILGSCTLNVSYGMRYRSLK